MIDYKYDVIRSRRRSLSVSVSAENKITVRCPLRFPDYKIVEFLNSKKAWLDKIISKNEAKLSVNDSVINYREVYVGGKKLPLIFSNRNVVANDGVYVKNIKAIKHTFISAFGEGFLDIVKNLSTQLNLQAKGFFIKSYKSRWGCCDKSGNIFFNWNLFMLSPEIQRYVIIHELAHLVYFNHSEKFWRLVESYEP
ncbi:MAG: M48 family metallopeptidase, partial [Clostridia bacterium]|nr:M48 family metallopeptidase [Clostridia bacterium]